MRRILLSVLVFALWGASWAFGIEATLTEWYAHFEVEAPSATRLTICHGFACTYRTPHRVTAEFATSIARMMPAGTAAEERRRVAAVVANVERRVAGELGGPPDRARADPGDSQVAGQMDCLDEATNTTTVLLYLEGRGLLRHHRVARPEARGFFTFGAHATAVMVEQGNGTAWAIDSWVRPSGGAPDVLTLEAWLARVGEGAGANAEGEEAPPPPARPRR